MVQQKLRQLHAVTVHRARSCLAARPVLAISLAVVWSLSIVVSIVLLLGSSKSFGTHNNVVNLRGASQLDSLPQWLRGLGQHSSSVSPTPYACDAAAQIPPDEVQKRFATHWGHSCVPFRQACYDQGNFVVYGKQHHPWHQGIAPISALKLGNNHLDFKQFGDVIGISQFPEIIFRPANKDEEAADLRRPVFTNCARPVVLYLNHLYMFGDFCIRTLPALMNALAAGAWDTDYTIVVATGGQSLDPWQKLLLQPFSKHPIVTLSEASSRTAAYAAPADSDDAGNSSWSSGSSSSSYGRLLLSLATEQQQQQWQQWKDQSYNAKQQQDHHQQQQQQQQQFPAKVNGQTASSSEQGMQRWAQWRQQWLTYKQQHFQDMAASSGQQVLLQQNTTPLAPANPPVMQYGRCFESLTVCSIQNPKVFGQRPERETWRGVQYVKAFWERQYAASYKQLLPEYERMKQKGAFKVVFAVRSSTAVRNLLNQQELLDWCNNWTPTAAAPGSPPAAAGTPSSKYISTVCVAHQFGQHGKVYTYPVHQAATAATMESGQLSSSIEGASSSRSSSRKGSGFLSVLQDWAVDASGTMMGFISGHRGRALLPTEDSAHGAHAAAQHLTTTAAAAAPTAAAGASMSNQHRHLLAKQQVAAAAATNSQSQSQSTWSATKFDRPADLPEDPKLDPRALLSDVALLDEADVVVGLHGAQLYNALLMPPHKALIEVRPMNFTGGWPETYFKEPLVGSDNMDSIFWFGIDTVKPTNSQPGKWERQGTGCCHERDRHTRIEPAALEYLFRRIIWAEEDPARYRQLDSAKETHITDTLQTAAQYYKDQDAGQGQVDDGYLDVDESEESSSSNNSKGGKSGGSAKRAVGAGQGQEDDGYVDIEEPQASSDSSDDSKDSKRGDSQEPDGAESEHGDDGGGGQQRSTEKADHGVDTVDSDAEKKGGKETSGDQSSSEAAEHSQQQQQQRQDNPAGHKEDSAADSSKQQQQQKQQQQAGSMQQVQLSPDLLAAAEQAEFELQADEALLAWEATRLETQPHHVASWQEVVDDYAKQPL